MAYHPEAFEMFLSQEQFDVFRGERIPWLAEDTWRATGMDNTLFPKGEIPMKRIVLENDLNEHNIAMKYYALAHRAGRVNGPPAYRVRIRINADNLLKLLWEGSAKIYPEPETLALTKPLDEK